MKPNPGLWTAFFCLASAVAGAAELTPQDLGVTVRPGPGFTEWQDADHRFALLTFRDAVGRISRQELRTPGGALRERFEYGTGSWSHERFTPQGTQIEIQTQPRPGILRIERRIAGEWQAVELETTAAFAESSVAACPLPDIGGFVTQIVDDVAAGGKFRSFVFDDYGKDRLPGAHDDDEAYLGYNAVGLGCATYPEGGAKQLGKEMSQAIKTGVSCLAQSGSAERKADALRILSYYQGTQDGTDLPGRVRLLCTTQPASPIVFRGLVAKKLPGARLDASTLEKYDRIAARAVPCPESNPPAIILNYPMRSQTTDQRASTLFHEMTHWLNQAHQKGHKDLAYLAELCCFPKAMASGWAAADTQAACALLKSTDASYSPTDQAKFLELLKKGVGRADVTD